MREARGTSAHFLTHTLSLLLPLPLSLMQACANLLARLPLLFFFLILPLLKIALLRVSLCSALFFSLSPSLSSPCTPVLALMHARAHTRASAPQAQAKAKRSKLPSPDELFETNDLAKPKFLTTAIEVRAPFTFFLPFSPLSRALCFLIISAVGQAAGLRRTSPAWEDTVWVTLCPPRPRQPPSRVPRCSRAPAGGAGNGL